MVPPVETHVLGGQLFKHGHHSQTHRFRQQLGVHLVRVEQAEGSLAAALSNVTELCTRDGFQEVRFS